MKIIASYLKKFLIYYVGVLLLYVVPATIQYGCYLLGFEGPFRLYYMGDVGVIIEYSVVIGLGILCCWAKYRQNWRFDVHIFAKRQNAYIYDVLTHLVMLGVALAISCLYPVFIVPVMPYLNGQPAVDFFYLNNVAQPLYYVYFSAAYLLSRHLFDHSSLAERASGQMAKSIVQE